MCYSAVALHSSNLQLSRQLSVTQKRIKLKTISRLTCPKIVVHFTGSYQTFFFFADTSRKKGFQPVKRRYFRPGQQKRKTARKNQ